MTEAEKSQLFAKIDRMQKMLEDQEEVFRIFIAAMNGMNERLDGQIAIGTIQTGMIGRLADVPPYRDKRG